MKILVTAFEPFGGETVNASLAVLRLLPDELGGAQLVKAVLPVAYGAAPDRLKEAVGREKPEAVLCLGQAGGRTALTPERVAINCADARIPDNAGQQPIDEPLVPGGPDAHFATLPIRAMAAAIREAGLPAEISNTAGTFVCNAVMYALLEWFPEVKGGFLHLPWLTEQAAEKPGAFGLSAQELTHGVAAAVRAIAQAKAE